MSWTEVLMSAAGVGRSGFEPQSISYRGKMIFVLAKGPNEKIAALHKKAASGFKLSNKDKDLVNAAYEDALGGRVVLDDLTMGPKVLRPPERSSVSR